MKNKSFCIVYFSRKTKFYSSLPSRIANEVICYWNCVCGKIRCSILWYYFKYSTHFERHIKICSNLRVFKDSLPDSVHKTLICSCEKHYIKICTFQQIIYAFSFITYHGICRLNYFFGSPNWESWQKINISFSH